MKQKSPEEYVQMDDTPWALFPEALSTGGITWRLLHVSPDMGSWTAVFDCPAGSSFNAHFHTWPGRIFPLQRSNECQGGSDNGGIPPSLQDMVTNPLVLFMIEQNFLFLVRSI